MRWGAFVGTAVMFVGIGGGIAGCGGSLPRPTSARQTTQDYIAVPFSPDAPPIEFVPPSPARNAVWMDGSWSWAGRRWRWTFGSWVVPPMGVRYARWVVVRRTDGQLFFAPSVWRDAAGTVIPSAMWLSSLGPRARATARPGAAAPAAEDQGTSHEVEPPHVESVIQGDGGAEATETEKPTPEEPGEIDD